MSKIVEHPVTLMRKELDAMKKYVIRQQEEIRALRSDFNTTVQANLILSDKVVKLEDLLTRTLTALSRLETQKALPSRKNTPGAKD